MSHRAVSRLRLPALALFLAALAAPFGATDVRAAEDGLSLVTDARYDVRPDEGRVRVTVDIDAIYRRAETATRRFFVEHAFLAVPQGTTNFRIEGDAGPSVSVTRRSKTHTMLRLDFGAGCTAAARWTCDCASTSATPAVRPAASCASATRSCRSACGRTPATTPAAARSPSSCRGYDVEVPTGALPLRSTAADGRQVLRSGPIARPATFFAYVVADRPGAYRESRLDVGVGGRSVDVMLAPGARMQPGRSASVASSPTPCPCSAGRSACLGRSTSRSSSRRPQPPEDGFAGLFEPAEGRIEIAYYADTFVVLHEAAHTWFNGSLLADRWANEAFASLYAERAAAELGLKVRADEMTDELRPVAVPLNAWASSGETEPWSSAMATRRRSRWRGRSASGPATIPCAPCGRPRCRVSPPTSRRTVGPSTIGIDPTGADCSTCSRSRPARRSTTSGGPGSPGLPTRLARRSDVRAVGVCAHAGTGRRLGAPGHPPRGAP